MRQAPVAPPARHPAPLSQGTVIWVHPAAPAKPEAGAPCNGCGLCCLHEPCPVGMLLSRRRLGACSALRWSDEAGCYRCGLLWAPAEVLPHLPAALRPLLQRLARRWISAASGCDCDLQEEGAADVTPTLPPPAG